MGIRSRLPPHRHGDGVPQRGERRRRDPAQRPRARGHVRDDENPPDAPERGEQLEQSLRKLGLDYVDLYLIHWPLPAGNASLWRALESLRERGLALDIGVSNFGRRRLESLLPRAARRPAVNQVEFNPFRFRHALLDYCREKDIVFEAYSPLARGKGLDDPAIVAIAERLDRTPAQVVLRWAVQHGAIVIPKSGRQERIRENARIFDFELSAEDIAALDALDRTGGTAKARF